MDTRQWDALGTLLVDAPWTHTSDFNGDIVAFFESRGDVVAAGRSFLEAIHSIHQGHNKELARVSPTVIDAIWSMEGRIVSPEADPETDPRPASDRGYGHDHETWVPGRATSLM